VIEETFRILRAAPDLHVTAGAPLASCTRFGIGGPAAIFAETASVGSFVKALETARSSGMPVVVIGGGTNLIVADEGFPGIVLRFVSSRIGAAGNRVTADAGAELDALVDYTVGRGLAGLQTLARVPGWVGAAVYGNAGAYGHAISEAIAEVTYTDGRRVLTLTQEGCQFRYRESIFKRRKDWIVLSCELLLKEADAGELRRTAAEIRELRDRKFPPTMKCAGSIFKNLILAEISAAAAAQVPEAVVREGKAPAAWFLEQVGAKGMALGGIRVADYHANLLYNAGGGTARDLVALIKELKSRVRDRFSIQLEEEIQYVGFEEPFK
jgi:UDP-N-acetylmuramate dehydrogenase